MIKLIKFQVTQTICHLGNSQKHRNSQKGIFRLQFEGANFTQM